MSLYELLNAGVVKVMYSVVASGKVARVYRPRHSMKANIAVKILNEDS